MNVIPARIGDTIDEIDTPALIVDLDAFEYNIHKLASFAGSAGVRLRPHAKTHKCPTIALKQIAAGAVGQCCQKVGEAEALVRGGVRDVLVSNEVIGVTKLRRLAALAAGQTDTWIGRFYRRKRAHLGAPKAITATAHKLACVIYHMLKYQEEFLPLDVVIYDVKAQEHRTRRLRKQAEELGFELVERKEAA